MVQLLLFFLKRWRERLGFRWLLTLTALNHLVICDLLPSKDNPRRITPIVMVNNWVLTLTNSTQAETPLYILWFYFQFLLFKILDIANWCFSFIWKFSHNCFGTCLEYTRCILKCIKGNYTLESDYMLYCKLYIKIVNPKLLSHSNDNKRTFCNAYHH